MQMPPKQTVVIDGQTLEYARAGTGDPVIVLVNGSGGPIEGWMRVFEPLSALGTVLAYNRPGIGRSGRPQVAQTGDAMVQALRALLAALRLASPYLLVGHSLGGLVVNLFARRHPAEVAGVVMLEATAPEDPAVMAALASPLQRGLQRLVDALPGRSELAETANTTQTVQAIAGAGKFPPVPLVVLSGGKPAMAWATPAAALQARAEHQRRLATLSPLGTQKIAPRSGHFPQLSEPEAVVDAVRHALRAAVVTVG